MGMEENLAGLLCYVFGWISGVVFLIAEKESRFVKFHAWQSIMFNIALIVTATVISMIPVIGMLSFVIWIGGIILWVILLMKAYKGERYKLPFIGDIAEKQAYGT